MLYIWLGQTGVLLNKSFLLLCYCWRSHLVTYTVVWMSFIWMHIWKKDSIGLLGFLRHWKVHDRTEKEIIILSDVLGNQLFWVLHYFNNLVKYLWQVYRLEKWGSLNTKYIFLLTYYEREQQKCVKHIEKRGQNINDILYFP